MREALEWRVCGVTEEVIGLRDLRLERVGGEGRKEMASGVHEHSMTWTVRRCGVARSGGNEGLH